MPRTYRPVPGARARNFARLARKHARRKIVEFMLDFGGYYRVYRHDPAVPFEMNPLAIVDEATEKKLRKLKVNWYS